MTVEYTLVTDDLPEQELVKGINKNIKRLAEGNIMVKGTKMKKDMHPTGVCNPDPSAERYTYDHRYWFSNRYMGFFLELYPNVDIDGKVKFQTPGALWNLYLNDWKYSDDHEEEMGDDPYWLVAQLLQDIPLERVFIKEYQGGEDRL